MANNMDAKQLELIVTWMHLVCGLMPDGLAETIAPSFLAMLRFADGGLILCHASICHVTL